MEGNCFRFDEEIPAKPDSIMFFGRSSIHVVCLAFRSVYCIVSVVVGKIAVLSSENLTSCFAVIFSL